jgi:hypothetical protein
MQPIETHTATSEFFIKQLLQHNAHEQKADQKPIAQKRIDRPALNVGHNISIF